MNHISPKDVRIEYEMLYETELRIGAKNIYEQYTRDKDYIRYYDEYNQIKKQKIEVGKQIVE